MSKIPNNGVGTIDSIKNEDDLKTKPEANINPPTEDVRCDCCGKHISVLKPFGGPGDPLVGDFTGELLVKGWRSAGIYDEEAEKACEEAQRCYEADGFDDPLNWMIDKYGREEALGMDGSVQAYGCVGSSWECRECIVLDMHEYFEKLKQYNK